MAGRSKPECTRQSAGEQKRCSHEWADRKPELAAEGEEAHGRGLSVARYGDAPDGLPRDGTWPLPIR